MSHNFIRLSLISLFALNLSADEFADDFDSEIIKIVPKEKLKPYLTYGSISLDSSYNYAHEKPTANGNDFRSLSSLKLSTNINLEYKFENSYRVKSTIKAHRDFIYNLKSEEYKTTPKDYESYADINELYLQGSLSKKVDFKVGRQIVVWGKSDNIRVTDILNPLDNTTPAMVDIEDLRLGRAMSRVDFYLDDWAISVALLHENRFSRTPQYGSDFMPFVNPKENEPSDTLANTGIALSIGGNFEGYDLSFYYANQYMDKPYLENAIVEFERSNMFGFAYNRVFGNFLLKTEVAYFDHLRYSSTKNTKEKLDLLAGVEYNGIDEGSISLEVANRHIFDYETSIYSPLDTYTKENEVQYALRFTQSYINNTLDFTTLYSAFGGSLNDGGFVRAWFEYDIDDELSTTFGVINYLGGYKPNWELIKDNDRVFVSFSYNF